MFYIVETEEQLTFLEEKAQKRVYLEVIPTNDNYHPVLSQVSAVYLHVLGEDSGFIIPIQHDEGVNVGKDRVYELLKKFKQLYTLDKKRTFYHFILPGVIDIRLLHILTKNTQLELGNNISIINNLYNRYPTKEDLNNLIPITKLHERCEDNYKNVKDILKIEEFPDGFDFYNTLAVNIFFLIEKNGIRVDEDRFKTLYNMEYPEFNLSNGSIYTYYNMYNTTTRPTNSFNNVNFLAIPKKGEFRECFLPKNDYFLELDFDGYHLRLLCDLIGYPLTQESAHMQLAKLYKGENTVTEEEYNKAKQLNFQIIYGNIPKQYESLEISKKIQSKIDELWNQYQTEGFIRNPHTSKKFEKELDIDKPAKLLNYLIQSLETSNNIRILLKVLKLLSNKTSTVALYTYDSVIFDMKNEESDIIESLVKVMSGEDSKYPVNKKVGTTLVL